MVLKVTVGNLMSSQMCLGIVMISEPNSKTPHMVCPDVMWASQMIEVKEQRALQSRM